MTASDYLIDVSLIALVLLQVRGRRLTARTLILPVAIVAWVGRQYLQAVPSGGHDVALVAALAAAGAALGVGSGLATQVSRAPDGSVWVRARLLAATLWVAGTGSRLAFQVYATHGGQAAIGRWMSAHHLVGATVWTDGLILMALGEVLARTGILAWRAWRLPSPAGRGRPVLTGATNPAPWVP